MPTNEPKKLGKYEVLEAVGHGGMGVVYKAVDPEIGRLVGIKMMTSAVMNDPGLLKRFYREAQSAGKLRHPNIVTIYDLGVQEATPYIVMEFLEGESLDVALRSGRALSLEEKLNIVTQVCSALAYAHDQSIIHRDIKPGNVMVLKDGTVKLVDFGIARIGTEYVTRAGQLMGSIQYMSPEQIHGAHVDLRTDIFSTGVLLYQMLTNTLPFEAQDAGATLLRIIHNPPPPLSNFLPEYPRELDAIVQRVLAKNPDDRYQTASELAFDLSQVEERLKRKRVAEQLKVVERSVSEEQWDKAREQLLQLLKVDRQNTKANALLREVQQQIQKQQRFQRIQDLQTQAEEATTRNALDEALRYLDIAVGLDESNSQLRELRDSIKSRKERADKVAELLARAKSAFDTQDLEDALASAQQALNVDGENADAKKLHAAIAHELLERAKLKRVQSVLDEARKQISSRHFTAALEVLRQAKTIDPEAPGVNELMVLASTGQQQERRRKELEQLSGDIEEALNRNDYAAACTKAADALDKFPNDRGLLKLKALADKEREAAEKRIYVESQVSLARRLLEEKKSAEALGPLQEALAKYPDEFILQSMYSLITEYIERDRAEQFKGKITQQAKEAIRRKAYAEAIEILQAAQRQSSSGEFDDLLQFAQEEAANYAARQKVDAAAEEAHQLMSADKYEQAVAFLETILREVDDQELRIILEDARRHVDEFNADLKEAIATARRLANVQRFNEAVKFLESHAARFGKTPEFSQLSKQIQKEQRRLQAFSLVKEQAREALANSDFKAARSLWEKYCEEFGNDVDTQLLQREIEAKESEAAVTAVAQALKDCRVLLLVGCYQAVLDILDRVSGVVAVVPSEMKQDYEFARASAVTGVNRERHSNQRYNRMKQRLAQAGNQPTLSDSQWETAGALALDKSPIQETRVANLSDLENVLGEVTLIAKHYAGDQKIQSAVGTVREQLTIQIAALRRGDSVQELETQKPVPIEAPQITKADDLAEKTPAKKTPSQKKAARIQPPRMGKPATSEISRMGQSQQLGSEPTINVSPVSETQVFPLGVETVVPSAEEKTAIGSAPQTLQDYAPALKREPARLLSRRWVKNAPALLVGAVLLALIIYMAWRLTHRIVPGLVSVQINTNPEGASVWIKNTDQKCVAPQCSIQLFPGQYNIEAQLRGYQAVSRLVSVNSSPPNSILIQLAPIAGESPGKKPMPEKPAHLEIRSAFSGSQVFVDNRFIGKTSRHGAFATDLAAGDHEIKLLAKNQNSAFVSRHFSPGGRVELAPRDFLTGVVPLPTPPAEQSDWERIKESSNPEDLQNFLRRYPEGRFRAQASAKLEDLYWSKAEGAKTVASFREYLDKFPSGKYADAAQREIEQLDFEAVQNTTDTAVLEDFVRKYPSGALHDQALVRLDELLWERAGKSKDASSLRAYLQRFPKSRHADDARRRLDQFTSVAEPRPQPTRAPLAPPSVPVVDNNKAVLEVLALYQKAYENKSIEELKKIWPAMSHQQVSGVGDFFRTASSIKMNYSVSTGPEIVGDEAVVTLQQSLSYVVDGKLEKAKPASLTVRLKKMAPAPLSATVWQIDSISIR